MRVRRVALVHIATISRTSSSTPAHWSKGSIYYFISSTPSKMFKAVLVFCLLLIVKVLTTPLPTAIPISEGYLEEACVRQGGICLPKSQCDPDNIPSALGNSELCPIYSLHGFVCCYF